MPRIFLAAAAVVIPLIGCSPTQGLLGVGNEPSPSLLQEATSATASLSAEEIVGGQPETVGSFCDALAEPIGKPASYDQAESLYDQADEILKEHEDETSIDVGSLVRAAQLSCSARFGFDPQEGDLWAWNEYHIGSALLLLGKSEARPDVLKVALLASSNAAGTFPSSSEGWGWSQHNVGHSAAELWRLENAEAYRTKAAEAFREVANSSTPASAFARAELERLEET